MQILRPFWRRSSQVISYYTVIENHPKCRILIYQSRHFPIIFVQLKVTCLVTLFDRKLQVLNATFSVIFKHCARLKAPFLASK